MNKNFRSKADLIVYLRTCLRGEMDGRFSVHSDPCSDTPSYDVSISWEGEATTQEVQDYIASLDITLFNQPVAYKFQSA